MSTLQPHPSQQKIKKCQKTISESQKKRCSEPDFFFFIFSNIIFIMPHRILFFIKSIVKIPCSLDIFSFNERKNNQLN